MRDPHDFSPALIALCAILTLIVCLLTVLPHGSDSTAAAAAPSGYAVTLELGGRGRTGTQN